MGLPFSEHAHRFDPILVPKVVEASSTVDDAGPLVWSERALVSAIVSCANHRFDRAAYHAELLRVALEGQHPELPQRILERPRAIANDSDLPRRVRMLAELAIMVSARPWSLSRAHRDRAHEASLSDDDMLHAITLAACCGHLDRVGDPSPWIDLRQPVRDAAFLPAPLAVTGKSAIALHRRPATASALAAWRTYVFDRDAPLSRRSRTVLARWVALWLGDGGISPPSDLTINPIDDALRELSELITLSPWALSSRSFDRLREQGFQDAQLFDACVVASSMGVFSRITVALGALGRDRG